MSSHDNDGKHINLPEVWDELADKLSSPQGLETVRLLQAAGLLLGAAPEGMPAAVVQAAPERKGDHSDSPENLRPSDRRRVCLVGESVAAGLFYAPWLTPAKYLAGLLSKFGPYEVEDLAKIGTQFDTLVKNVAGALQTRPDLLVVLAGNNWIGLSARTYRYADRDLDTFQEYASAVRQHGMGGFLRVEEERIRSRARSVVDRVAALAVEAGIPVIFVIPASNLVDFETLHPVLWLPGDGVDRWHTLYHKATADLSEGDSEAVEAAAREMIDLDGGHCPTSQRLLAGALLLAGRTCEALEALQADLDTSCWEHRFGRSASAPSSVCSEIQDGCRRHGLACVDLPRVFAERAGSGLLGSRFFLDHCHMTAEGIQVSMAAVAEEALRLGGVELPDSVRLADAPALSLPPLLQALSRFHAGLYTAHLSRPVNGGPSPLSQTLFEDALDAAPGVPDLMRDYMDAMTSPGRAFLTAACARNQNSPYPLQALAWLATDLSIETLEPMCRALEARGTLIRDELDRMLIEHHAVDRCRRDLAVPKYRESDPGASAAYIERQPTPSHLRALFPRTGFFLVTDGERGLRLDLTLRLPDFGSPRSETVEVSVNGVPVGSLPVGEKWARHTLDVDEHRFHRGLNRVSLSWPLPGNVGDLAIQTAVHRLQQGLPADIFPVFGEVFSLYAGSLSI
jgi:hypothetical protein